MLEFVAIGGDLRPLWPQNGHNFVSMVLVQWMTFSEVLSRAILKRLLAAVVAGPEDVSARSMMVHSQRLAPFANQHVHALWETADDAIAAPADKGAGVLP